MLAACLPLPPRPTALRFFFYLLFTVLDGVSRARARLQRLQILLRTVFLHELSVALIALLSDLFVVEARLDDDGVGCDDDDDGGK